MASDQFVLNDSLLPPFLAKAEGPSASGAEGFSWLVAANRYPVDRGGWSTVVSEEIRIADLIQASLTGRTLVQPISQSIPSMYALPKKSQPVISWRWARAAIGAAPTPFARTISLIDSLCNCPDPLADVPTPSACESARQILSSAHRINEIANEPTVVETSDGDILLHWDLPTKSVVLICPGDGRAPSIYRETLNGVLPINSELQADATARSLSEALAWVLPPR